MENQSKWRTQLVSDIIRDGQGVELVARNDEVVAEVFRCDANHTVSVSIFVEALPLLAMEILLAQAKSDLIHLKMAFHSATHLEIYNDSLNRDAYRTHRDLLKE